MANITEMGIHRILNRNLLAGNAQCLHQLPGIAVGAVRGTKAWHCDAASIAHWTAKPPHCLHCHQQGQGGIQSPGYAYNRFGIDSLQPLGKAGYLEIENRIAPLHTVLAIDRNKGKLIELVQCPVRTKRRSAALYYPGRFKLPVEGNRVTNALVFPPFAAHTAQIRILH